jgi:Protein of unknown function (DUF1236)
VKHKLFITSAAAALLAGTVLAAGQGMPRQQQPGAGQERGAPQTSGQGERDQIQGKEPGQRPDQSEPRQRPRGQAQGQDREQGRTQGQRPQSTIGQGQRQDGQGERSREPGQRREGQGERREQTQGQGPRDQDRTQGQRDQGRRDQTPGERQGQGNRDGNRDQTQGQGPGRGAGAVSLTTQQRTMIREKVLVGGNAPRATNINFRINVGVAVPTSVRVATVPVEIVEIYPAWRGFLYFVYEDEIVIVDPRSHKIVAVLEV